MITKVVNSIMILMRHFRVVVTCTVVFQHHFWATVCKTVPPMLLGRCLSVCDVGILWPNGWINQDETWHAGSPRRVGSGHIVLDGDPAPLPKRGTAAPHRIFGPCLLWPNGWIKMSLGTEAGLGTGDCGDTVLDGNQSPPKKGDQQPPYYVAHF